MEIQLIDINEDESNNNPGTKKRSKNDIANSIESNDEAKMKSKSKDKMENSKSKSKKIMNTSSKPLNQLDDTQLHQNQQQQEQEQPPRFYKNKRKKKQAKDLQRNVAYPQATIREYLNQKRTTQNKVCHVLFCIYMIIIIMLAGVGFFYGHYVDLGTLTKDDGQPCQFFINETANGCMDGCNANETYLQKICLTTSFNPTFSSNLDKQITMRTLKETFVPIVYSTIISLTISFFSFICLICFAKLIYFYIALTFIMLIGFAFYLLKTVNDRLGGLTPGTIFYKEASNILPLAYILMALYMVAFPFVLFSPSKIKSGTRMIQKMSKYFSKMSTVNFFSYLVIFVTWGLTMLQIFLLMNMFTSGQSSYQTNSFMPVYTNVSLSHPGVLTIHFFGIYWFFSTLISWHKYFTSNAMCLWYFEEGQNLYPVQRGLKRSWYSLGTAAIDALLFPFQWLMHVIYCACKVSEDDSQRQVTTKQQEQNCSCFCIDGIRQCLNSLYCKVNCHSSSSAPLTNYPFKNSCEISAVTFSMHDHKFFNIGSTLTVLLTLYNVLVWVIVCYAILYAQVYNLTKTPSITSLALPMICVFLASLIVGAMFSNMYTSALDCLIFCFLLQKKNNVTNTKNQVKDLLEQLYNEDQTEQKVQMFQYGQD